MLYFYYQISLLGGIIFSPPGPEEKASNVKPSAHYH